MLNMKRVKEEIIGIPVIFHYCKRECYEESS